MIPDISVIIPTRQRVALCKAAVDSFFANADNPSCFEVLLKVDIADEQDYVSVFDSCSRVFLHSSSVGNPHLMMRFWLQEVMEEAKGWVFIHFNDDEEMRTKGWDSLVIEGPYPDHGIAAIFGEHCNISPSWKFMGLTRRLWETLGYWGPSPRVDDYVVSLLESLPECKVKLDLEVFHNRWDLPEATALEDDTFAHQHDADRNVDIPDHGTPMKEFTQWAEDVEKLIAAIAEGEYEYRA